MKKNGFEMCKQISSGGIFRSDVYDNRTVHSFKELNELNKQGFNAETDMGTFIFNALIL